TDLGRKPKPQYNDEGKRQRVSEEGRPSQSKRREIP
ncbi:hypothetical protein Pmani_031362, partial [Petrolisthes manimaculis]